MEGHANTDNVFQQYNIIGFLHELEDPCKDTFCMKRIYFV